jgi:hypothetical protein
MTVRLPGRAEVYVGAGATGERIIVVVDPASREVLRLVIGRRIWPMGEMPAHDDDASDVAPRPDQRRANPDGPGRILPFSWGIRMPSELSFLAYGPEEYKLRPPVPPEERLSARDAHHTVAAGRWEDTEA